MGSGLSAADFLSLLKKGGAAQCPAQGLFILGGWR
jgi:hypothetical protein